ncbi:MAG TPA: c-type cytochrome [Pirellulales bacterium]
MLIAVSAVARGEQQYPPSLVAPTEPLTPAEQQARFHLPPGFVIELVACEPAIHKPMNLNFDGRGRLYVTSSLEYPFPVLDGKPGRDTLHVLADHDGDGSFESVTQVVGGLNIPIGVTPVAGGVIYYSIPDIYGWTGDVEHPEGQPGKLLYGTFGSRDTHGMANSFTRWIDGWIYACHGFSNTSNVAGADRRQFTMQSGNTFRMRADGSHAEQVTHGQVNPFGLCFDPLGNLFSADCHTMPIYQLLRGAYYPSFGKPHDGLEFGPTMIGHSHGSTGIAGVVYYAAEQFPPEYRNTVFIGNPVTGRVNHDQLRSRGTTLEAVEQPDFITCDDPWFRPVDLKLGPDGALYIADFYNRIIGHYEVPLTHPGRDRHRGRIWRVRYQPEVGGQKSEVREDAAKWRMPELAEQTVAQLIERLGHANLTVRVLATEELATRSGFSAEQLLPEGEDDATARRRAHGLWLVERKLPGGLDATTIERLANDASRLVRVHLVKALSERPVWLGDSLDIAELVRGKLEDADPWVRRAAADALGRHPQMESVEPLLRLWAATSAEDSHLIHVVRMALRDHLLVEGMYARLAKLAAANAQYADRLAEVSLGAATPAAGEFVFAHLRRRGGADGRLAADVHHAARYLPADALDALYAWVENRDNGDLAQARDAVLAIEHGLQERGMPPPEAVTRWAATVVGRLLATDSPPLVQGGVALVRELKLTGLQNELTKLATASEKPLELRSAAIDACVATDADRSIGLLNALLTKADEPLALRQKAAGALANLQQPAARVALLAQLRTAADRLAVEIAAALALRPDGAEALLNEVAAGKASPRLLVERVVRERLTAAKVADLDERLARLTADLPPADERIAQLIAARRDAFTKIQAEAAAGKQVFQKSCAGCHRVAGQGAKVGPDLDGVGLRGLDRLLEDVLDPSRNVDQAFRATVVSTSDGLTLSGLALREEGAILVMADSQGKEVRIPTADIDEREVTTLSPMPSNVADLLPESDFAHLLAFLLSQQQKGEK